MLPRALYAVMNRCRTCKGVGITKGPYGDMLCPGCGGTIRRRREQPDD